MQMNQVYCALTTRRNGVNTNESESIKVNTKSEIHN